MFLNPVAALVVLTLKYSDRSVYDKFISGAISGYHAAAAFNLSQPNPHRETAALMPWMQAQLVICSLGPRATTLSYDEFMGRFIAADAGSSDDGAAVHAALQELYSDADNISTVTTSLPYLASLVEMSEPPA